jgi:hypothetical protein
LHSLIEQLPVVLVEIDVFETGLNISHYLHTLHTFLIAFPKALEVAYSLDFTVRIFWFEAKLNAAQEKHIYPHYKVLSCSLAQVLLSETENKHGQFFLLDLSY